MENNAFTIPNDWQFVPLGEIATCKGGFGFPLEKQGKKSGEFPFFKVSDMNLSGNEKFMRTSNNWVGRETLLALKAKTFPKSTIIFPKIGAAILTNKKRILIQDSVIDNNIMAVVVNDESKCVPEFLYYWFLTVDLAQIASPGTVPSLTSGHLQKVFVTLPPFDEQLRINRVLTTVQNAIAQQERLIVLTVELKRVLMHKLFTDGLSGEKLKHTEIGLLPESWNVEPLDKLLTQTQYGLSLRGEETGKYGILRMTNQLDGKISTEKMQFVNISENDFKKYQLKRRDILFNRTNSIELVGRTAIFDIEGDFVFASYLIRLNTDEKYLNPFFLNHYLNCDETQHRLKSIALRAVSQSNISATRLRSFRVPVPPLQEQERIIAYIDTLINKIEVLRRKKTLLEELFYTCLHQLIRVKTRVNNLEL